MRAGWRLGALLLVASSTLSAAAGAADPGWRRHVITSTGVYADRYLPHSLLGAEGPYPAVVFFHGAGSTPEVWRPFLQPVAEAVGTVLVVPKSASGWGWGVGRDEDTVTEALSLVGDELSLDGERIGVAGHSSGGAYAYVLGLAARHRFSAIFSLAAPYRTVLAVADPRYTAPVRLYYGAQDPNVGLVPPITEMLARLGVPHEVTVAAGHGHSSWPPETLEAGFGFLLSRRYPLGLCTPAVHRLCLAGGRYAAEARWTDYTGGQGEAWAVPLADSDDAGLLWFFTPDNVEMLVKVLDGCPVNGHRWVFAAATTDVGYTLTVTDLLTSVAVRYDNPLGRASPAVTDTEAFGDCP